MWEVEYTDEFGKWWDTLSEDEIEAISFSVGLLKEFGPSLKRPYADTVRKSRHANMRELRSQAGGTPLRTFYAFDSRRVAILLIGGDKTGDDRFYDVMIPTADKIYDEYLKEIGEKK